MEAYQKAVKDTVTRIFSANFTPAVMFTTSDISEGSATLIPHFVTAGGGYFALSDPIRVAHRRGAQEGVDLFRLKADELFPTFMAMKNIRRTLSSDFATRLISRRRWRPRHWKYSCSISTEMMTAAWDSTSILELARQWPTLRTTVVSKNSNSWRRSQKSSATTWRTTTLLVLLRGAASSSDIFQSGGRQQKPLSIQF